MSEPRNPFAGLDGPSEQGEGRKVPVAKQVKQADEPIVPVAFRELITQKVPVEATESSDPFHQLDLLCRILGAAAIVLGVLFPAAGWVVGVAAVVFGGILISKSSANSKAAFAGILGGLLGIVVGIQVFFNRLEGRF